MHLLKKWNVARTGPEKNCIRLKITNALTKSKASLLPKTLRIKYTKLYILIFSLIVLLLFET
jgi:hypothetical protein